LHLNTLMFFEKYFPQTQLTHKFLIPEIVMELSLSKNLCLEVATSRGRNIKHLLSIGWPGKVIGYDLWDGPNNHRENCCPKPDIPGAELIQGDIFDTLIPSYNGDHIDILFLDLDGDPDPTMFSLNVLSQGLTNSFIFVDEFYGFDRWESKDIDVVANWLVNYGLNFDIPFRTQTGALIKTGAGHSPGYLLQSLNNYINGS